MDTMSTPAVTSYNMYQVGGDSRPRHFAFFHTSDNEAQKLLVSKE
jgi:hypothetical protein